MHNFLDLREERTEEELTEEGSETVFKGFIGEDLTDDL